jgi:hypothetical protein
MLSPKPLGDTPKNVRFLSISPSLIRLTSRNKKDEGRAMQDRFLGRAKSITGATLIGLGIFVLYENLDQAAIQLSQVLGIPGNTFGMLPTVILAALRVLQAYAVDHQRFVADLSQHALATFWPLLLVIAGTVLSRDAFPGDADTITKKDCGIVDLTVRRSTLK